MVSQKLQHLIDAIAERAAADDVFCPGELEKVADYLAAILPLVAAMEPQPVPLHLRSQTPGLHLIQGGVA